MIDRRARARAATAQKRLGGIAASEGFSVISNRTVRPINATTASATSTSRGTRMALYVPFAASAFRIGYENAMIGGSAPAVHNTNDVWWQAALEVNNVAVASASGSNVAPSNTPPKLSVYFGGKNALRLSPGMFDFSDNIRAPLIRPGTVNFINSMCSAPTIAAPAAPTLGQTTGGSLTALATFNCGYTLVYADGSESPCSTAASITLTSGNQSIIYTAPAAATYPAAIGWRAYISLAGGTTPLYYTSSGVVPMGTNFTAQVLPATSNGTGTLKQVLPAGGLSIPTGGVVGGGTGSQAFNNGETIVVGISGQRPDLTVDGFTASASYGTTAIGPWCVLARHPQGKIYPSLCISGDSINAGTGDTFAAPNVGGAFYRIVQNHPTQRLYDPTITPYCGHIVTAVPGQTTAQIIGRNGLMAAEKARWCTHVVSNSVTNAFFTGTYSATELANKVTEGLMYTPVGVAFRLVTMYPRTASTDGWLTVANQSMPLAGGAQSYAGSRVQFNNVLRSTATAAQTITGENMFRCAASITPATNVNGGDGTATIFTTAFPFVQGSEAIRVNGVLQVLTTDYTYTDTATIAGVNYASGVVFNSAPGNGLTVTANYTGSPGFLTLFAQAEAAAGYPVSGLVAVYDGAAAVEANNAGALALGGMWWGPPAGSAIATGTIGASGTTSTFTTSGLTQDQYRGYTITITADGVTPSSVGQTSVIYGNTTTVVTFSTMAVQPSSSASYSIGRVLTQDGSHPTPDGNMQIVAALNARVRADLAPPA